MSGRYVGRPWTRVLDAFVLDAIGQLDEQTATGLQAMAPKLRATFGMSTGSWQDVVRAQMDIDAGFEQWIRDSYAQQLTFDDERGQPHDAVAWAHAVSDHIAGSQPGATD